MLAINSLMKNRIKETRNAKGMKQRELASICDMDVAHLSRIERAHVDPTMSTAKKIADGLGVSLSSLFLFEEAA